MLLLMRAQFAIPHWHLTRSRNINGEVDEQSRSSGWVTSMMSCEMPKQLLNLQSHKHTSRQVLLGLASAWDVLTPVVSKQHWVLGLILNVSCSLRVRQLSDPSIMNGLRLEFSLFERYLTAVQWRKVTKYKYSSNEFEYNFDVLNYFNSEEWYFPLNTLYSTTFTQ